LLFFAEEINLLKSSESVISRQEKIQQQENQVHWINFQQKKTEKNVFFFRQRTEQGLKQSLRPVAASENTVYC
jgi:hypothetical protein